MVFGHNAINNILPWLRKNYLQKFLIQNDDNFLNHSQKIQFSYTLDHAWNCIKMFEHSWNFSE